ncbi:MAG: hypothetical protein RL477_645 [Pseudomonadota bacterium]|jgi:signal transduction histidine kinase
MSPQTDSSAIPTTEADAHIFEAQVRQLYSFPQRIIGNAINAAIVVAVMWNRIDAAILGGWLFLHVLAATARLATAYAYRRRDRTGEAARWARYFVAGSACTGALWGACASIVWLVPDIAGHVFVAFVIAGTTSAAAVMSYPVLVAFYVFGCFSALPLAAAFLLVGDGMHLAMGLMTLLLLVLLVGQARVGNAMLVRTLRLQEENRLLVADLSAARDNLEARVRDRTGELDMANRSLRTEMAARLETENRLQQAQKMEAIGQLTGGVAHDFNNLLAVIQGNSELLVERLMDDQKSQRELHAILRAVGRGSQLTQRLLAFSRKQALQPQAVDVNELLTSMADMLGRTLGGDVIVSVHPALDLPPALVDPGQLENAILNLAINARDAMPDGGQLRISSSSAYLSGDERDFVMGEAGTVAVGRYVVVEIQDAGSGIPKDQLDRVWEPFFTTKRTGEGTGLGLSMVYGFVRQSGGQVAIDSVVGKGTTIRLYLPCAEGAGISRGEREDVTAVPSGNEYVFLIDDDPEIRAMVEKYLARLGYRIVSAGSAEEAFEKLARYGKPDLFLSDVLLPGGNRGPAIVAGARATLGPVKAVFMSGHAAAGFADVLGPDEKITLINKPFELAEMARVVRRALDTVEG